MSRRKLKSVGEGSDPWANSWPPPTAPSLSIPHAVGPEIDTTHTRRRREPDHRDASERRLPLPRLLAPEPDRLQRRMREAI
jgi:hypothetical protein